MLSKQLMKYRIRCTQCDKTFILDTFGANVPRHRQGTEYWPSLPYIACPNSGRPGILIENVFPNREGQYI